jgi:hypothetical protein
MPSSVSAEHLSPARWRGFLLIALLAPTFAAGCLGRFAANQGRRQAARSSDYYLRKYAEPELAELYAGDPEARVEVKKMSRKGRNWLADVVVHSRSGSSSQTVLLDPDGKIVSRQK